MKTVCNINHCTGCMACVDICPKNAVKIKDSLRAYNAIIDEKKCIDCNACQNVCQEYHLPAFRTPVYWKEGWAVCSEIRMNSSSGGFAASIELAFVKSGGIVCSCLFEKGDFIFSFAKTEIEVKRFAGSKYVKSRPEGIYRKCNKFLQDGKKVLFVGLPCQVAAVKIYTGNHKNLYTIDLICHGTPSPEILKSFLKEYQYSLKDLKDIKFRTKNHFGLGSNQISFTIPIVRDGYTAMFLNSTSYTENCYECKYAKIERISDLTLGDSWGSNLTDDEIQKGISLALCQTEKGWELLTQANLHLLDVDLKNAIENNHQLSHPSVKPIQREYFFDMIEAGKKFNTIILKCYPERYIKNIIKTIFYKLKILGGGGVNCRSIYNITIVKSD